MKTFTLLSTLLAVFSIHGGELNFKRDTPISYSVVFEQTLTGNVGAEKVQDSWKYELDFDLVQKKTIDQGICFDVTLRRFGCTVLNAKGPRVIYDSSNPAKTSPIELNEILDIALFLHFPSRYERKNGKVRGEKNNYPFQQYLKDIADKSPNGPIKEIMQATHNFWFLDEKTNILSLLSSILNDQLSSLSKGGQQIVALQSTSLYHAFPLSKGLSSFEKALWLKPASCLLFITSDSSTADITGAWDEAYSSQFRDPSGLILKEVGSCKGSVKWDRANALLQDREWTWDNDVSEQNSQISLKFSIKHTIKSQEKKKNIL